MSLIIIGEAATKVMDSYAEFTLGPDAQVPWRSMRGMRNRIAHGYFNINLDLVWETVQTALPDLLKILPTVRRDAGQPELRLRFPQRPQLQELPTPPSLHEDHA